MNRSVCCYPQPRKQKSREILEAFTQGCEGIVADHAASIDDTRGAAFFGVVGIERLFQEARARARFWCYGDNSFLNVTRGTHFRFARDAFQISTSQPPDWAKWRALALEVAPWRRGDHVVVVEQSAHFLSLSGAGADWLFRVLAELGQHTDRPVVVRRWDRDKGGAAATLRRDINGAHALVTHMSAAANEALLYGVPVFCTGPCAATPMASGGLENIESPRYPEGREEWAAGLAGRQWTLEELRGGAAWRAFDG